MNWIKDYVTTIADYPKPGIMFRDVTTIFESDVAYNRMVEEFVRYLKDKKIDKVAGIEARGFILGGAIAHRLGVGFITVRKAGKLPRQTHSVNYMLEYGEDALEVHCDAIRAGDNILIVDDLIATGGTAIATHELITIAGGRVTNCVFIIDLPDLGGADKLRAKGCDVFALTAYEGE
ncbi:MAG: adenine phosphoribosyltransferase [Kordiimonadaceae bacterium]|nr:adenine phosphoribosyltransferase [Kordiimonadaceae bacterium]